MRTAPRPARTALLLGALLAAAGAPPAAAEGPVPPVPPLPDPVASYDIRAGLDADTHQVEAEGTLTWRNAGPGPVDSLWLHLYLNAFKNELSTFMREAKGSPRSKRQDREEGWGWIDLHTLKLEDGTDLRDAMHFESPDDGNPDDRTVARVRLPRPVPEGETLKVSMGWTARLPRVWRRTGWHGDFHLVAQWFPKPGVRRAPDPTGERPAREGWTCRQFHANSEFFSDFGDYRVSLQVPGDFVVGATGRETAVVDAPGGRRVHTFEQEGVVDFTWTASPRFHEVKRTWRYADEPDPVEEARLAAAFGRTPEVAKGGGDPVEVRLLLQPDHAGEADRVYAAVARGLKYFGLRYGPYPWRTLTVVDPPHGGAGAGGMEYPTLFTIGIPAFPHPRTPSPEGVTIHELGHQWFAMAIATDEAEEAWLDEGLNTYATARVLETAYPEGWLRTTELAGMPVDGVLPGSWRGLLPGLRDLLRLPGWAEVRGNGLLEALHDAPPATLLRGVARDPFDRDRDRWLAVQEVDPLDRPSWRYFDRASYGGNSYARTSATLRTLERELGRAVVDRALGAYALRHRFRHPTGDDLFAAFHEAAGRDLAPLLHHLFRTNFAYDYSVEEVKVEEVGEARGWFDRADGTKVFREGGKRDDEAQDGGEAAAAAGEDGDGAAAPPPPPAPRWRVEIALRRTGRPPFPVEGRIELADGTERRFSWDGREPWVRHVEITGAEPVRVRLDPDRGSLLEGDRGNDGWRKEKDRGTGLRWGARVLRWVEGVLFTAGTTP